MNAETMFPVHLGWQVRPSFVEASLRRTPGHPRAADHLLLSYKAALLAVLGAQLDDRGFADGMQVTAIRVDVSLAFLWLMRISPISRQHSCRRSCLCCPTGYMPAIQNASRCASSCGALVHAPFLQGRHV